METKKFISENIPLRILKDVLQIEIKLEIDKELETVEERIYCYNEILNVLDDFINLMIHKCGINNDFQVDYRRILVRKKMSIVINLSDSNIANNKLLNFIFSDFKLKNVKGTNIPVTSVYKKIL